MQACKTLINSIFLTHEKAALSQQSRVAKPEIVLILVERVAEGRSLNHLHGTGSEDPMRISESGEERIYEESKQFQAP